jgi:aspartyl-tRNA(Asn)/glutamyl-tRNA(Gln) amidotransferase subunit A
MADISRLSAAETTAAYAARKLSPVEAATDALRRLALFEPAVNAFTIVDADGAMAAARASEERWMKGESLGPADGIVATVKSNVAVKGWHMRRGSTTIGYDAMGFDAPAAQRLKEAGSVLIGQTTMPEFGWIGVCHSRLTGATRNPWRTDRTTGGSSGGAAAAGALGIGHLHVGTDAAGSIRIPASFSGLVGLNPGFGRVPAYPASPFGLLARIGPMARTAADAALMLGLLAKPDRRDVFGAIAAAPDYAAEMERGIRGKRIAFSATLGFVSKLDPAIESMCRAIAHRLTEFGAVVAEADPGFSEEQALKPLRILWEAGCSFVLAGVPAERRGEVDGSFRESAARGDARPASDVLRALADRAALHETMRTFHERHDLLLTPTMPIAAFEAGRDLPASGRFGPEWFDWSPYTWPFNVTGQPAASVPVGLDGDGLPIGLQIVAPQGGEALVLRAARCVEALAAFPMLSEPVIRH